jgi:molecular chaperone DnaK (HSP70)
LEITREKFAGLTADLVKQIVDCAERNLKEGNLTPDDIKAFVPVGGGILVPAIAEEVERRFGKPLTVHSDVHFCVAKGAMIMARLELESRGEDFIAEGGRKLPPSSDVIRDTTAHPLGVAALDHDGSGILRNSVILAKGRPMPSTKVEKFQLSEDGQTCALVELKNLQPVRGRPHPIEIKFSINADGILSASAFDPLDGSSADMTVDYKK